MLRSPAIRFLIPVLIFALPLLLAGCSDDANPTDPGDDTPANTPPIPTVSNPNDELPAVSALLDVEEALLGNFSPKVTAGCALVDSLNAQAVGLHFQMVPGYCRLVKDGGACPPTGLQFSTLSWDPWHLWSDCVPDTVGPIFPHHDSHDGRHYYGLGHKGSWMVLDLNCRLAGGNLACIGTSDENSVVHGLRQSWFFGEYIALGCHDWNRVDGDFVWRSGEPFIYDAWGGNEPNNDGGEYFGMMYTTNSGWNDYKGLLEIHAIMETDAPLPDETRTQVPVLMLSDSPLYLGDLADLDEPPHIVRSVYWAKVFQTTLGAGATYSEGHTYTHGTSETNCLSFGWSIGIEASAGWGPVSVSISSEFHQDFSREISVSTSSSVTRTYECTAPADQSVVFALWQLRERYTIRKADGTPWTDPRYELDGELPYLEQGLEQEYLQTIYFDR